MLYYAHEIEKNPSVGRIGNLWKNFRYNHSINNEYYAVVIYRYRVAQKLAQIFICLNFTKY